jgi:uncharacterized protein
MHELDSSLAGKRERLLELIEGLGQVIVAYSGGIDSTVVAKAAQLALGERALAVTGTSASLAAGELDEARAIAEQIGIRHEVIATDEFSNPRYVQNSADRCYHCKTELYTQLEKLQERYPEAVTLNGANLDDGGDYRPGLQAAAEHRVRSPLAECGFTKSDVRQLAAQWELPTWDKPASPCLSSRVAYGEAVSPERLAMIDAAEQHLRSLGLRTVRVRYHAGDLARIEAPVEALAKLCEPVVREALLAKLRELGFRYATLDLAGFRSGSLNDVLPVEALRQFKKPTAGAR